MLGASRWVAGRLMGLGLDWRKNLALNDERRGLVRPVMRLAINWRDIAKIPSSRTPLGLRRLVARDVAEGILDSADCLRTAGADPDFPEWKDQFDEEKDRAINSMVDLLVDGRDPDNFWESFLNQFQASYIQLEALRAEEFFQRTGYRPDQVTWLPSEDDPS